MEKNESKTVVRTDLLIESEVKEYMKKIEEIKIWIILAATGQIELNDADALTHLKDLTVLNYHLEDLNENLEAELITFDHEKAWGKFD